MSGTDDRILICTRRESVAAGLKNELVRLGVSARVAAERTDWPERSPALVFLDLADLGPSVREARLQFGEDTELVAVVDTASVDGLLAALAAGCTDYLFFPINRAELNLCWRRHREGLRGAPALRLEGMTGRLKLEFPSRVGYVRHVVSEVVGACERFAFSGSRATLNLRVAVGEALANAILYGNREDAAKRVRLEAQLGPGSAVVTVTDEGTGFDPSSVDDPTLPGNRLRSHGRGLFLLRKLADDVRFNEKGNSVTITLRG